MNRITVFERPDATSIFVEWWDDEGRHRESLRSITGEPVTDKKLAIRIADRMAAAQERRRNQAAAEAWGIASDRSLPELLTRLHADRGSDWSESYVRDQERYRDFWLEKLGDVRLSAVSAAVVERVVREEARAREKDPGRRPWSPRTQGAVLRYLVDAFHYGHRKLRWITAQQTLAAVEIPKARSESRAYTLGEARKLLPALAAVDPRAGWIGWVAALTGRRLTAIRTLRKDAVTLGDDFALLAFPSDTDKARNSGQAMVAGEALALTRSLMREPGGYVTGLEAPTLEECRRWLAAAEKAAGIEHRKGRAWHGLKRLYATMAKGHPARDKQSGTTGGTLDRVYVQDEPAPKIDLAQDLATRLGEA